MNNSSNMKIFKYLLFSFLFQILGNNGFAQCSEKLIEEAASKAGSNAIFMREFRVHLREGTIKNPAPLKKITVLLHKNVLYRFTVADSKEYNGRILLQLFHNGELLGTTFNLERKEQNTFFDYRCSKNGSFTILLSFENGIEGCGIGVMSMVMNDSLSTIDPSVTKVKDNSILYLGIENELGIASDEIQDGHIDVRISQGIITSEKGKYIVRPDKVGNAILFVSVFDKNNSLKSIDSVVFMVNEIPLPTAKLNGKTGGFMPKNVIQSLHKIELQYDIDLNANPYELMGFTIQKSKFDLQSFTSGNAFFTTRQIQFLQTLQLGETFTITHILVKGANNKVYELDPLGFIVD